MSCSITSSCSTSVHLLGLLREYVAYYNADRTHLGLDGDAPEPRAVEPPEIGGVVALPRVGGLITAT